MGRIIRTVGGGALIRLTRDLDGNRRGILFAVSSIAMIEPWLEWEDGGMVVKGAIVHLHGACGGTGGRYVNEAVVEIEALILEAAG